MKYSPIAHPAYGARYSMAAGSDAEAATTMEYFMVPVSSSLATRRLMLERFWPMAT